ncbi:Surfactin synthase thioesterase subunit [Legionella londiniensis]|uniref:Phenyloxazoline synthase MbtB n=2 Tax=Legionella londiniensis TaxID=45068 RepID=A0A0W0VRQ6_9GAMM|nr:Phenyloxazoline synthase MbtB [Legionella londiniensis]STX92715.1 Surfactin synthase thioesterase subunit [Legionella londiniensis]
MVLFPYAGGLGSSFYAFAPHISSEYDLYVVEYPGRCNQESSLAPTSFLELSLAIMQLLSDMSLHSKTLSFCGVSMGGYIAFHIARLIEHYYGIGIERLIMISVCSESKLMASLNSEGWLESLIDEYNGLFEQDFLDYLKNLMQKDRNILKTMQLGMANLTKTPINIVNSTEDTRCHSLDTKHFWQNKTTQSFDYRTYEGKHVPRTEQLDEIFNANSDLKFEH